MLFYPPLPDREVETPALTVSTSLGAEPGRESGTEEGSALSLWDPPPPWSLPAPRGHPKRHVKQLLAGRDEWFSSLFKHGSAFGAHL